MSHINAVLTGKTLFGEDALERYARNNTRRVNERAEWIKYFSEKTGKKEGYIRYRLTGVPTADLEPFAKKCDTYNGPWSKCFFGCLKVKEETTP